MRAAIAYEDVGYRNGVVGIAAPREDLPLVNLLAAYVNSGVGSYYLFHTSSTWGVERRVVEVNEILSIPVPTMGEHLEATNELVNEAAHGVADPATTERFLDALVNEAYNLSVAEQERVHDTLNVFAQWSAKPLLADAFREPTGEELRVYASVFVRELGQTIAGALIAERHFWRADGAIGIAFRLGSEAGETSHERFDRYTQAYFSSLSSQSELVGVGPVLRGLALLDGEWMAVMKPSQFRFWSRSSAQDDADRVTASILQQARS